MSEIRPRHHRELPALIRSKTVHEDGSVTRVTMTLVHPDRIAGALYRVEVDADGLVTREIMTPREAMAYEHQVTLGDAHGNATEDSGLGGT